MVSAENWAMLKGYGALTQDVTKFLDYLLQNRDDGV